MKFSARLFAKLFFGICFLVLLFPSRILAQAAAPADIFSPTVQDLIDEETNAAKKDTANKIEIFDARINNRQLSIIPISLSNQILCVYPNCNQNKTAIGALTKVMAMTYEYPPASAIAYTHDLLANAGLLAKPAYAQGIGFAGLAPLLPLWKASRDISYAILIIVMVAIGFMIIFRMKIDPKTVISVQAALPKIILTLILITFSYPIAGFLIDIMYLSILILIKLLANAAKSLPIDALGWASYIRNEAQQQTEFLGGGGWKLLTSVFSVGLIPSLFQQSFFNIPGLLGLGGGGGVGLGLIISHIFLGGVAAFGLPAFLGGIGALVGIILVIIALGLLFTFIRITFLLINSYIQLLLAIILAPLLLLKEAVPGQSAFQEWIQNIIANLVVFPTTVGVLYLSWIFTAVLWSGNLWKPPLTPFVGGSTNLGGGNPLAIFIGLGTIFLAPNLIASVKKAFHAKPTLPVTAGTAFSPVTGVVQTGMGAMSQYYYMTQVFGEKGAFGPLVNKITDFFGKKKS